LKQNNNFLSAWNNGSMAVMKHLKGWEVFYLVQQVDGSLVIKTTHETYLSVGKNGIVTQTSQLGENEMWNIFTIDTGLGQCVLQSIHGTYLSYTTIVTQAKIIDKTTSWELIFQVPQSIKAPQSMFPPKPEIYINNSCFEGGGMVKMWKGTKFVRSLQVGDIIDSNGKPAKIEAITHSLHNDTHPMVYIDNLCITTRHPIFWNGKWQRPLQLAAVKMVHVDHLFNFVVEGRGCITVEGFQCSSLGQFLPGIDDADTFLGSERVIESLKMHPQWPTMDLSLGSG